MRNLKLILIFIFIFAAKIFAMDLSQMKIRFLEGNYSAAIIEGEKLLAASDSEEGLDELYYYLGLSYLKDGNYLRASDIFEIIINELKNSPFKQEARLGLGDAYYMRNQFDKAEAIYNKLLEVDPNPKLKPQIYSRLSQVNFKKGNSDQGQAYLEKLKTEFPFNPEEQLDKDICSLPKSGEELFYTVQVGVFSRTQNADNLVAKLKENGYDAYVEEIPAAEKKVFRVRVGKCKTRAEALLLKGKLSEEGLPTKVCP